ncbi:hypothetical protein BKA67DRAFT_557997 [Truncatella angustata]|uniref:FAD-binding PCMH-type domain-containing protein n=1 Tax=Truncatella angustata TaxID=152316 RepID=A0A9P9A1S9_9PEZI|nr:uncharacterized protein BKA67DRAFT_557997 [Truncatella angustata]KAH6658414.1 hypothetical protein BKA67DRAFT_557997 [Truncatella angustata]
MASTCCTQVFSALGALVYPAGTDVYASIEASYWSTEEASLEPACFFRPHTSTEVSRFISLISTVTNCDFAIKSQGHAPAAGSANIDRGVTIDLSWLNETTITEDRSVASVGTGSSWADVYTTLNPFNKTVAGGRNGAVGVGGLTLGGGISYYSPEVGWTCDTVLNFEVVLASGEIVNANSSHNPDLYRALKGGGNNFGVVTRIDYSTIDTVPLRAGHLFQEQQYLDRVLAAFANIASSISYDIHASIVMSLSFNATTQVWTIISVPIYTLPNLNPDVYQDLVAIPRIEELSTVSIENISTLAVEAPYPQKYQAFFTSTYAASSQLLIKVFDVANKTLQLALLPLDVGVSLTFEPLPIALIQHGARANSLGISPSDGNGVILLISVSWSNATSSGPANHIGSKLLDAMDARARVLLGLHKFKYLNYANPTQRPLENYGKENLAFLKNVSTRYDPGKIFQKKVPGGFKLWSKAELEVKAATESL